jgi:hypothetical protein
MSIKRGRESSFSRPHLALAPQFLACPDDCEHRHKGFAALGAELLTYFGLWKNRACAETAGNFSQFLESSLSIAQMANPLTQL